MFFSRIQLNPLATILVYIICECLRTWLWESGHDRGVDLWYYKDFISGRRGYGHWGSQKVWKDRGTASSPKHAVAPESNTMAPEAKTMTTLDFFSKTTPCMAVTVQRQISEGETTATVGHQSVTPTEMTLLLSIFRLWLQVRKKLPGRSLWFLKRPVFPLEMSGTLMDRVQLSNGRVWLLR